MGNQQLAQLIYVFNNKTYKVIIESFSLDGSEKHFFCGENFTKFCHAGNHTFFFLSGNTQWMIQKYED